jgi:hypothetical protein
VAIDRADFLVSKAASASAVSSMYIRHRMAAPLRCPIQHITASWARQVPAGSPKRWADRGRPTVPHQTHDAAGVGRNHAAPKSMEVLEGVAQSSAWTRPLRPIHGTATSVSMLSLRRDVLENRRRARQLVAGGGEDAGELLAHTSRHQASCSPLSPRSCAAQANSECLQWIA